MEAYDYRPLSDAGPPPTSNATSNPTPITSAPDLHKAFDLLVYLATSDGAETQQIMRHFDVSERTVRRWLDILQNTYGAMVEAVPVRGNKRRYRVNPAAGLRDASGRVALVLNGLDADELFVLLMALQNLSLSHESPLGQTLQRLAAKLELLTMPPRSSTTRPPETWLITLSHLSKSTPVQPHVMEGLLKALQENRAIQVRYTSPRRATAKDYQLSPHGLFQWNGGLYVLATREGQAQAFPYAVERCQTLRVLDQAATTPPDFDPQAYLARSFNLVVNDPIDRVTVHFDADQAPYALERDWGANQTASTQADGSCIITFDTNGAREVVRWILGFGHHARVIGPPELLSRVANEAHRMAALYPSAPPP